MCAGKFTTYALSGYKRIFAYAILVVIMFSGICFLFQNYGHAVFGENAVVENLQIILLLFGAISFGWQAKYNIVLRPILLFLGVGCLLAVCSELDDVLVRIFPNIYTDCGFLFAVFAVIYVYVHRKMSGKGLFSLVHTSMFCVFAVAAFALLALAEFIEPQVLEKGHINIETVYEEIIEVISYLLIFLSSLEIHLGYPKILNKFYEKYGRNIEFELLSKTADKTVYNVKTEKGEYILMIVFDVSSVRFLKYVSSQGVQQQLFEDNMDVAPIVDSYIDKGNLIYLQKKIEGSNSFPRNKENMYKMGELLGKLHKISSEAKYSNSYMFIKYPNILVRWFLYLRESWLKKISFGIRYFNLRHFPKGICHRDINQKNIIMRPDGTLALIDFDMHRYQPFVEGLIRFYKRGLVKKEMFYHFIKGYNSVRPLTKIEKDYIENKLAIKLSL